jgi:hypothetical protein
VREASEYRWSSAGRFASRNEIEFRKYQKYSADTNIKFDDTEATAGPDSKPDEQNGPLGPKP